MLLLIFEKNIVNVVCVVELIININYESMFWKKEKYEKYNDTWNL